MLDHTVAHPKKKKYYHVFQEASKQHEEDLILYFEYTNKCFGIFFSGFNKFEFVVAYDSYDVFFWNFYAMPLLKVKGLCRPSPVLVVPTSHHMYSRKYVFWPL